MQQPIIGFDQDEQSHWRALLACGHAVHMRHDPPWTVREWVLDPVERQKRLGTRVECKRCDEPPAPR